MKKGVLLRILGVGLIKEEFKGFIEGSGEEAESHVFKANRVHSCQD